MLFINLMLIVV